MVTCSPASCEPSDAWTRDARWPFHVGALLFGAVVAVTCALVSVACTHVEAAPFTCPEAHTLQGSYRVGAHWCAREIQGRKHIDGRFVTWNNERGDDGVPGVRREVWYRAGRRHGPVREYARPTPGQAQGPLTLAGAYSWGRPVGVWRFYDEDGRVERVVQH